MIDIISKKAAYTPGVRAHVFGGSQEYGVGARYGGEIGDSTHYRVSLKGERIEDYAFSGSYDGNDAWGQLRLGFRSDTKLSENRERTFLADYFDLDREAAPGVRSGVLPFPVVGFAPEDQIQRGGNVVVKYAQDFDDGSYFEAKSHYDGVQRNISIKEESHMADLEFLYNRSLMDDLDVIVGGSYRFWTTIRASPRAESVSHRTTKTSTWAAASCSSTSISSMTGSRSLSGPSSV